jgi:hypothetical protein
LGVYRDSEVMPTFEITSPDGKTYRVDAPEGATGEMATMMLQNHLKEQEPSATGAFLRGAERSALPAVAGMAGMGVGEIAGPVGGLALGFGAASGAEAVQEKFLEAHPNVAKFLGQDPESRKADIEAHPWAANIGEIVPNVPMMARPSREAFGSLSKATKDLLESAAGKAPEALSVAEKEALHEADRLKQIRINALKTSAGGAAIMGGINTAQQLLGSQPFDYTSLLESAGVGALGTKETRLGKRIKGFGENLVSGKKPTEIVPPAAESATPSSTETTDEMGESAPVAGGTTVAEPTATPKTPLNAIIGDSAAGAYKDAATPPPAVQAKSPVATVDKPVELPESIDETPDDGITRLDDLTPQDPEDHSVAVGKESALAFMGQSGKTSAIELQKGLGLKLSEAKALRQSLIDDGALVKEQGKYVVKPIEVADETGTPNAAAILPDAVGGEPTAGVRAPVQLDAADRAGATEAVGAKLGVSDGAVAGDNGGEKTPAGALEEDPVRKAVVDRIVRGVAKNEITEDELAHLDSELQEPSPDYAYISNYLDVLTAPKSREDFFKQVRAKAVAKGIMKLRAPKPKRAKKAAGPVDEDQEAINRYIKANPKPISGAERTSATTGGATGKTLDKLKLPKGWKQKDYDAAVTQFLEDHPQEDHPQLSAASFPTWQALGFKEVSSPLSRDHVQKIVNDTMLHWSNPPNIGVHASTDTLPAALRDKVADTDIHGIHHPQLGVHLIAGSLHTPEEVRATLFHEVLGHRGLTNLFGAEKDNVMRGIYNSNSEMRNAADKWKATFGKDPYYNGYTVDQINARAVEEVLARRSEAGQMKRGIGFTAALRRMTAWVRDFARRHGMSFNYSDNDVMSILRRAHESVVEGRTRARLSGQMQEAPALMATKKAEPPKIRTHQEMMDSSGKEIEKLVPTRSLASRWRNVLTGIKNLDYEEAVRKFENEQRPWVHFDRFNPLIKHKGLLDDYTDVAARMQAAGALGRQAIINEMNPRLKALHEAINDYAVEKGLNVKQALAELNLYRTALHEPERRKLLFAMEAPLSLTKKYTLPNGKKVIAADLRKDIILHLHQDIPFKDADIAKMRGILNDLVDPKRGFLDAAGHSRTGKTSTDENDLTQYKVAGTYKPEELQNERDRHDQDLLHPRVGPKLEKVWRSLKAVQDKTIDLNKQARYWSTPVDNLVKFYGYKNYVPFKGDPNSNADRYDHASRRLSGSYAEYERAAEGRESDSANVLLQSMSDAARSAARVGRSDVGTAFTNLIKEGLIKDKGNPVHVPFADRYEDTAITKEIQGQNKFINYNKDGSFDIYTIHPRDMTLLAALKGEIQSREGFLRKAADKMRPITAGMGRLHTLLNVAFAPYNYARHLITNSLAISSQYGVGQIPKLFMKSAINTLTGKMGTAMRMYGQYAFENGSLAALEKHAAKSAFARNLYEYIKNGGDTTMMDALQHKAIAQELVDGSKRINGNLVHATTDKLYKYFQLWAHGFELTNRATMYGVVKDLALKELAAKGVVGDELQAQAQSYASNYAKNLLNFQNVGLYGRDLSSVFMFYRAASTGAVRALDALRPAWVGVDQHLKSLPDNFKLTPDMIAEQTAKYKKLQTNARNTAMFMFGTGFAIHQMARMMAGDDEQGRNLVATDNMDQWQRNMRLPASFLGPGNNNSFIQFPWGYGIGSLGSVGAQVSGYLEGHTPFKDFIWNVLNPLRESFFPVPTANFNPLTDAKTGLKFVVDSITPSMFRPLVEGAMNIDTFGKEVTSTHMSKYGDVYSAGESIPSLYRDTAEYILEHTGMDIDPSTVQFVVNNYADGAARLVQNFHADMQAVEGEDNWDPKHSLESMPVSNFIGKRTSIDAKEFADVERDVVKMRDTVNMFSSTGRVTQLQDYLSSHPEARVLIPLYNSDVNGSIKRYRSLIGEVEASSQLTPKQKHTMLVDLKLGRDMSMRGFVDLYHRISP